MSKKNKYQVLTYLEEGAQLPERQTPYAAGYDVSSIEEVSIPPGVTIMVKTGLRFQLPDNLEMQIRPRSGLAIKNGIQIANSPGTLDADYRGELKILLYNASPNPFTVEKGMRIAQVVYNEYIVVDHPIVEKIEELEDTERGEGGFGHTGTD